jgi:hypothetical protein
MSTPTPEEVDAAMLYAKGAWLWKDINPLYGRKVKHFSQIPNKACEVLAAEVERLRARAEKAEAERAANFESLQICAQHCDDARAMVKSLVKERPASVFSTFHCHRCEITEDRLTQAHKALRQLVHEVHAAHRSGLPVAPYCADMLTAIQLLSSIKSPCSES